MSYEQLKNQTDKNCNTLNPLHKDSKPSLADYKGSEDGVMILSVSGIFRLLHENKDA